MREETKILMKTAGGLTALTLLTAFIATIKLGWLNFAIAMAIATAKVSLVSLFFMHVHKSKILVKIFAMGGVFWLLTLIFLTLNDYISRGWLVNFSLWAH